MFASVRTGSKNAKGVLASRVTELLRSCSETEDKFKTVEYVSLETSLKEDFVKHPWLHKLISAVIEDGYKVTPQQMQAYERCKNSDVVPSKTKQQVIYLHEKNVLRRKQERLRHAKKKIQITRNDQPSSVASLDLELRSLNSHALQLSKKRASGNDSSKLTLQGFQNALTSLSLEYDEHYLDELADELAIICPPENLEMTGILEAVKINKRLRELFARLVNIRDLLYEAKVYFDREDGLWINELFELTQEVTRESSHLIIETRRKQRLNMELALDLANLALPSLPKCEDQLDIAYAEIKNAAENLPKHN